MRGGRISSNSTGFILLMGGLMSMPAMTIDINLPAVPETAAALGASLTTTQWSVAIFFLGFAIGQAFYGPYSDRYGRKPLLLFGIVLYLLATLGCIFSTSIEMLLVMRAIQGIGGGAGPVLGRAIIRDLFEGPAMARIMSFSMAVFILAPIIAPSIGALILEFAPWQAIFVFLAIYGLAVLAAAHFLLEESLKQRNRDATQLSRMFGAYRLVFTNRSALLFGGVALLTLSGLLTYLSNSPAIFMDGFGLDARQYGFVFAAIAACTAVGSLLNTRFIKRWSLETVIKSACILGLIASALGLVFTMAGILGPFTMIPFFAGFFFAFSLVVPNAMSLAMVPFGRMAGAASSAIGVLQAIIPSIIGATVTIFYTGTAVPTFLTLAILCASSLFIMLAQSDAPSVSEAGSSR